MRTWNARFNRRGNVMNGYARSLDDGVPARMSDEVTTSSSALESLFQRSATDRKNEFRSTARDPSVMIQSSFAGSAKRPRISLA